VTGPPAAQPWLVVIDMQDAFRDPDSVWAVPGYAAIEPTVGELCARFPGRTVLTRFVPDPGEPGQWARYYDRWPTMRRAADSPLWEVTVPLLADAPTVSLPTFGKWGPELARITGDSPLVLCGVATDCCVLATALAAADAGRAVTVVGDACAGVSARHHEAALELLGLLAPLVDIKTAHEVAGRSPASGSPTGDG
jgi:nicotinamidase-related amidase